MIALWLLYGSGVGLMLALAALAAERVAAAYRHPRRFGWALGLVLLLILPAAAALREARVESSASAGQRTSITPSDGSTRTATAMNRPWLAALLERTGSERLLGARSLAALDRPLAAAWVLVALVMAIGHVRGVRRLARRRRRWHEATIDQVPVLVAVGAGPAVIGALRPRIVLPEWALALDDERRSLMLAHEREHVRARDPLLAHLAGLAVLLMPWNAGAWWMLRRLRLAVELDCDARVLGKVDAGRLNATTARRAYGDLLLTVAARHTGSLNALAPALLERTSSLSRRIHAMQSHRPRRPLVQASLAAAVAALLVVVACEAPSPRLLAPDGQDHATRRVMGSATVAQLEPDSVSALVSRYFPQVVRGETGPSVLFIVRDAKGAIVRTSRADAPEPLRTAMATPGTATEREKQSFERTPMKIASDARPAGATRSKLPADMADLSPDDIATVDIVKHRAGTFGPSAVSVVMIVLK